MAGSVLAGCVTGFVSFLVIIIGVSVGIGTLPAALAGVLCFGFVLRFDEYFARFERARLGLMLGARLPGWQARARAGYRWGIVPRWRTLSNRAAWSEFGYALVRFPLSFAGFVAILGAWSLGLAMLTLPLYDGSLPLPRRGWPGPVIGSEVITGTPAMIVSVLIGAALSCSGDGRSCGSWRSRPR